jgi:hypothetical protein
MAVRTPSKAPAIAPPNRPPTAAPTPPPRPPAIRPTTPPITASEPAATRSGRYAASTPGATASPAIVQPRFVRSSPRRTPTAIPTTRPARNGLPTPQLFLVSRVMTPAATAMASISRRPRRMPQPIDPKSHSPRNSGVPKATSSPAKIPAAIATPTRIAARLIASVISANSAFASSTCDLTSCFAASRVALICSNSPGASGSGGGGIRPAPSPPGDARPLAVDPLAGSASGGGGRSESVRVGFPSGSRGIAAMIAPRSVAKPCRRRALTLRQRCASGAYRARNAQAAEPKARWPSRSAASKNPYARRNAGSTGSGRRPVAVRHSDRSSSSSRSDSSAGPRGTGMSA